VVEEVALHAHLRMTEYVATATKPPLTVPTVLGTSPVS
jgi:hypothetical protein